MKKNIFLLFLTFFIGYSAYAQKVIYKNYESQDLQDVRNIKIHLPKGYDRDTTSNYPLTIILGDSYLFDLYIGNDNLFVKHDLAPKQIIVGINMDETFTKDVSIIKKNSALTKDGENFYSFIKEELIPYVENNYKTSPFLTIVGEGDGANFITHFLKEKEPIFNAYVCLSPVFSPDILKLINSYSLARYGQIDNSFYFYTNSNQFTKKEQKERFNVLKQQFLELGLKNFSTKFDDNNNADNYLSNITDGISKAFPQIFELYSGISKEEFDKNIKDLSPLDAIGYLENKYLDIEYLFGTNMGIRKKDVFAIEGIVIDKENGSYLKIFGEMIKNLYPKSHLGDYYVGRFYEAAKDFKNALFHYKLGYGKINPADPKADLFFRNIERVAGY